MDLFICGIPSKTIDGLQLISQHCLNGSQKQNTGRCDSQSVTRCRDSWNKLSSGQRVQRRKWARIEDRDEYGYKLEFMASRLNKDNNVPGRLALVIVTQTPNPTPDTLFNRDSRQIAQKSLGFRNLRVEAQVAQSLALAAARATLLGMMVGIKLDVS